MAEKLQAKEYHESDTYKNDDRTVRTSLEKYKEELHISEEHMNWLMYLQDIRGLPKEQRQKGNHPAEMLVLGAMAMFLVAVNMKERSYLLIASVFVIFAAVLYLTGVLNPYSVMIRKIKKELKRFPKVPSYTEWSKPANADEKDS